MTGQRTQAVARIPPIIHHNYPVDVLLRIRKNELEVHAQDHFTFPLNFNPKDVEEINSLLSVAIEKVAANNVQEKKPTIKELEARLLPVAEKGHFAFLRLFRESSARNLIEQLSATNRRLVIQIVAEDFFIPWELIYPISPASGLSYKHFWGMKHIVCRVPSRGSSNYVSPTIQYGSCPTLGLLTYDGLPSVSQKEIPFFEQLDKDGKITLSKLCALEPSGKPREFDKLKQFCNTVFNIVHIACHAKYDTKKPSQSFMFLTKKFDVTLENFTVYGIKISGHPLVIMNACETGTLNPLYKSCFAAEFISHGVRGVIATECTVPDNFAADFAQVLYKYLLAGKPLGWSLLLTRRYFGWKHHNPTGLLYSMYAAPSVQLVPSQSQI